MEIFSDSLAMQSLTANEVDEVCDALRVAMRVENERHSHGGSEAMFHGYRARRFKDLLQIIRPKHTINQ